LEATGVSKFQPRERGGAAFLAEAWKMIADGRGSSISCCRANIEFEKLKMDVNSLGELISGFFSGTSIEANLRPDRNRARGRQSGISCR
jgi:hypothetical protein